jgi:hypothetical protein
MQNNSNKQNLNLESIQKKLIHGDIAKIARNTRYHRFTVQLHLEGRVQKINSEIIEAALAYFAKREKDLAKMNKKIQKAST